MCPLAWGKCLGRLGIRQRGDGLQRELDDGDVMPLLFGVVYKVWLAPPTINTNNTEIKFFPQDFFSQFDVALLPI